MNDEELRRTVQALADRHDIMDCLNRYGRGLDRRDADLLRSAFHPDATDHHGSRMEYHPAAETLIADWERRDADRTFSQHLILNTRIELDGDSAHAETYFQLVFGLRPGTRSEESPLRVVGGRYADRFERRDGEWRIARRVVITEFSGALEEAPLANLREWARRSTADPSYARPLTGPPAD